MNCRPQHEPGLDRSSRILENPIVLQFPNELELICLVSKGRFISVRFDQLVNRAPVGEDVTISQVHCRDPTLNLSANTRESIGTLVEVNRDKSF